MPIGTPHLHLRSAPSTNDRARELAIAGAPHGTLVTAAQQTAGRGRQGRAWSTPPAGALAMTVVLRDPPDLLPLIAGVAVARALGDDAAIKWPNDVVLGSGGSGAPRKVAGILAEGRPREGWAIAGIGVNVAVRLADLPPELHETAATLGLQPADVAVVRDRILAELDRALGLETAELLAAWRARDALEGREIRWATGSGTAAGIDGAGRLVVNLAGGGRTELDAGEVHLGAVAGGDSVST